MIEKICIILLVNFIFFLKTLGYKYCSDDIPAYNRPKEPKKWRQRFWVLEGRARSTPINDHALTMVIHALVCVGIYLGFGRTDISFLAALLFTVNPMNNQASVWIAGRAYALATLGLVWALAVPILGPLFIIGATYYNAGFLSSVMLVGSQHPWLVLFVPLAWKFHWKEFKKNVSDKINTEMYKEDKRFHFKKLILATKTFGFYLSHSLIPIKNTFYHSLLESIAGSKKVRAYSLCRFFWIGLFSIIGIFSYWLTHPWGITSFGLLWWCMGIAPFCNLIRMSQEIAERYCYLPNSGLMVALASIIIINPVLSAIFLAMYATKMWFYMDAYQDDYYIVEYACMNSPDSWFAWHIRGMKRWDTQSYREAIILWVMAKIISPKEFKILFNIATALMLSKIKDEALQYLKMAEENIPEGQEEFCNKLIADFRKGNCAIIL
jgi:hypothetical protein